MGGNFEVYIKHCIFLAEHDRSFHGYSSKISDPDTGLF